MRELATPQRGTQSFVGCWLSPESKRRLIAVALLRGVSQSELLRSLVEDAATRALGGLADDAGNGTAHAKRTLESC